MLLLNLSNTSSIPQPLPPDRVVLDSLYIVLYNYALPSICVIGSLGNVLNLLILTGKRTQHSLRSMERSANVGLIALAVADLSFCLSVFPSTFLPQDLVFESLTFLAYYGCYCAAVINVFIMTSTWLTVAMSMERYLAICHPLKSRNFISLGRTKATIVLVYLLSVVFNLPVFWRYIIVTETSGNASTVYRVIPRKTDETFEHSYRGLWSGLGNVVPLALLLLCNVALTREIHNSYALRRRMKSNAGRGPGSAAASSSSTDQESNHRITVTLVCIVLMFLLLVAPSEMLKQIAYLVDGNISHSHAYMIIELVTNLMQTINFSANFVLYCIINPSFRKTMWKMLGFRRRRLRSTSTTAEDATLHGLQGASLARADSQFVPTVHRSRVTSFHDQHTRIGMMRMESAL